MTSSHVYAAGLDAGSAHARCVICILEDQRLRLTGYGEAPSHGWTKGRISDHEAAAESIQQAVEEAERMAGISIGEATVGVGGGSVEGSDCRGVYEFGRPRQIDSGDLSYAVELASRVSLRDDRFLLQIVPQDFTLDGRSGYRNPRGATCSRLEANVHAITISSHDHQSVVNAVHQAHLAIEETIYEPIAAAYAAVEREDRTRGVAIVDIGAHSTGVVAYEGEALLLAKSLQVSADHFTRDVAFGLTTSYDDAERLKREYGCAMVGFTSDHSLIEVPSAEGRPPREAPRRHLNEILEARAEELLLLVRKEFARVHLDQSLLEGVVLTGGGALLSGTCDMAERVLNCPARLGLPIGIADWAEAINNPRWTAPAGLAMYSARLKHRKEGKRKVPSIMGLVLR